MKFLAGLFLVSVISFGVAVGASSGASAPAIISTTTVSDTVSVVSAIPIQATAPIAIDVDARCPQWWSVAVAAGWDEKDLHDLDAVMFRESRCDASQVNDTDPNTVDGVKGSVGLTQINVFWVQGTKWYPNGYLQTVSVVSGVRDLFDPFLNLRAAKAVFDYGVAENGCGWAAWAWKGCD